jgi:thymidylate kinase
LVFLVLEGFSGTGKTTIAKELERRGWLRIPESAHSVPDAVPLAERADTMADFSLLGATMMNCSTISAARARRDIVSEGYFLSDLAYAWIRYDMKMSDAFPAMLAICRDLLGHESLRPDLYTVLRAKPDAVAERQRRKSARDRNLSGAFRMRYYPALTGLHHRLGEDRVETVRTDGDPRLALVLTLKALKKWKLVRP